VTSIIGSTSNATNIGRGPTKGKGLRKINKIIKKKMPIHISMDKGRPVDRIESAKLSSELGIIARDFLPMPTKWNDLKNNHDHLTSAYDRLDVSKLLLNYFFILNDHHFVLFFFIF